MRYYVVVALVTAITGCSSKPTTWAEAVAQTPAQCDVTPELRAAGTAVVTIEMERALGAGKLRFVGIYGYALQVPGLSNSEAECAKSLRVVDPVVGTSDMIQCQEQEQLQTKAIDFAAQFNAEMRAEWSKRSMKLCGV